MSLTPELYDAIVRIVDQRVGEIKVTREDFDRLSSTVSELSVVVRELAEAQKRTEERLNALAEAQKRTEGSIEKLAVAVGRLSDNIGYGLEDVARVMVPPWLERHERIRVDELERRFIQVDGESIEVNLYGDGVRGRTSITIIGEAKSRIDASDVKEFSRKLERISKAFEGRRILALMFGYWIHPSATSLGRTLQIRLIASYQR